MPVALPCAPTACQGRDSLPQGTLRMLSSNCIPGPKDMGADPEREKRWVRSHGPAGPGVQSELQGTISPLPLRAVRASEKCPYAPSSRGLHDLTLSVCTRGRDSRITITELEDEWVRVTLGSEQGTRHTVGSQRVPSGAPQGSAGPPSPRGPAHITAPGSQAQSCC